MTIGAIRREKLQSNRHHQQTNTQLLTGRMPFLSLNQQCQGTEGKLNVTVSVEKNMGYWHQRADKRHGNPPQGNQELLVVRDHSWKTPGELEVNKSRE